MKSAHTLNGTGEIDSFYFPYYYTANSTNLRALSPALFPPFWKFHLLKLVILVYCMEKQNGSASPQAARQVISLCKIQLGLSLHHHTFSQVQRLPKSPWGTPFMCIMPITWSAPSKGYVAYTSKIGFNCSITADLYTHQIMQLCQSITSKIYLNNCRKGYLPNFNVVS